MWLRENGLTAVVLLLILAFAASLRLENVNWDQGQHLHPDERFLSMVTDKVRGPSSVGEYFDSARSPLNPYNSFGTFVYGTFPLFLNKAVAEWLDREPDGSTYKSGDDVRSVLEYFGADLSNDNGTLKFDGRYSSNLVGRVLSALFDVGTVFLAFELGRVLLDKRLGLFAAALMSLTAIHIQYSHFFGSETFAAFFVTAVIYFSVRILKYGSGWSYAFAGIAFGFALACKLNTLPVLFVPGIATLVRMSPQFRPLVAWLRYEILADGPGARVDWGALLRPALWGLALVFLGGLVFRIAQPYAFNGPGFLDVFDVDVNVRRDLLSIDGLTHLRFLDPTKYLDLSPKFEADIKALISLQKGGDFPPNMQWIDRVKYYFPAKNIFFWGLGIPLSMAVAGGMAYAGWRTLRRGERALGLLLLWVLFDFWFNARGFVPTMRYFIPIYPSMVVLGAYGLLSLWDGAASGAVDAWAGRLWRPLARRGGTLAQGAVGLVVLGAFLWAFAFTGIYRQDISRVQASRWIHANVPQGSTLSFQEWDDGLPLNLPGLPPSNIYKSQTLKPYVQDSPQKVAELVAGLDRIDYVVESSNRLYDSIPRIPARYPSTTLYYRYLFDGTLGFAKVAEFHNYPQLFGIDIPDQWSEEAFTVYDHPKVTIWQKTDSYSHDRALALLNPARSLDTVTVTPGESETNALRLRPDDLETQRAGGTWDAIFASRGFATHYPALFWVIVLEVAAFAVLPLTLVLFRRLPDRGYLLSKPLGLMLLAYPVWLIVSSKVANFSQETIALWLVVLLASGAVLTARFSDEVSAAVRQHARLFILCEVLFLVAFLVFYEFRLLNPDLWHPYRGGEKPMDLAYLTAVTRSTTLPPYDPWFAGGYINYYYMGQFFTATLSKVTGIAPEVAFNLAVPTYFALTVAGVFSVAYNLAAVAGRLLRRRPDGRRIPGWSAAATGILAVILVTVIGNLDGVGQMVDRLSAVSTWNVSSGVPLVAPVANSIGGLWQVVFHGADLKPAFDYWRPSRMMPPTISITEFPYFSFLFADLHAHMMAIPFDVLVIGMSAGLALNRPGERGGAREWLLVALLGVAAGALRWLNSWDYPPFLLLALAAIVIGERRAEGGFTAATVRVAARAALLVGVSFAAYFPFLDNYTSPVNGVHRSAETTPLHQYLAHFGIFLAAIGAWLAWQLLRGLRQSSGARVLRSAVGQGAGQAGRTYDAMNPWQQISISALVIAAGVIAALVLTFASRGQTTIALMVAVLPAVTFLAARELVRPHPDSGVRLFVLTMLGLAFGLSLGVDLVTINGDIQRMNTVFKFYLHIWILFGISAAFAVWYLTFVVWQPRLRPGKWRLPRLAPRALAGSVLVSLLLAGMIYPVAATPPRLNERFADLPPTLDGAAFMREAVYSDARGQIPLEDDYEGIQWMRHNVQGTPVIIEASLRDLYRWGSRFSIYTGLPTVMGWDWHQKQQRGQFGGPTIDARVAQVQRFYSDPDTKQAITTLSEYDVKYVIVGEVERLYSSTEGVAKFDDGLGGVLEVAYKNESLTIYRVKLDPVDLALRTLK